MEAVITEESHNRVVWEVRSSLLWMELGLLIGWVLFAALVVMAPSPLRWTLILGVGAAVLGVGGALALTTPLVDGGELERTPEGGVLYRERRWLFVGRRLSWEVPLEDVVGFRPETQAFEETGGVTYPQARLWAVCGDGAPLPLTGWLAPPSAYALGEALAKAGRRAYEG
jgi:hypothetical protein